MLFMLLFFLPGRAAAQQYKTDTLSLEIYFQQGKSALDAGFRGNGARMESFYASVISRMQEPGVLIRSIFVRASASPEGATEFNRNLSQDRARALGDWLTETLGVNPGLILTDAVGADWEGLARLIETCDEPWKDEALQIIRHSSNRKQALQLLSGGNAWTWMSEHLFPELRFAQGSVSCVIATPVQPEPIRDTVYIKTQTTVTDTVFVSPGVAALTPEVVKAYNKERRKADFTGKKMIFAVRTNALAVPLANIGVEVPIGKRWSVGIDYYYPWIWRPHHAEGLDYSGKCFELQALDIEGRYWFAPRKSNQPAQRLLGHSVGLYAAAGHYDFEQNFTGHQGEFYNVGVDYLYALPIFGGRLHLEFELGIGYIYSPSQPYDTFVAGEKAFRRKGVTQKTSWFGPTRAQVSLVWPIYVNIKKGGDK